MIRFLINPLDCNSFEIDMISNAKIEGLLMPKSVEKLVTGQYAITYEEPIGKKRLGELLNENYFDSDRYHDFLSKIIKLKIKLDSYMLNSKNLHFISDEIWYNPVSRDYWFIYLPGTKLDPYQELNLYRHIFIESYQILENNTKLLLELRQNTFDLDRFCGFFHKLDRKKKSRGLWRKFLDIKKEEPYKTLESKTIQKSRKPCLLDAFNPTIYYEIHFNQITIGRGDDCNIQIDDSSISRRHAVIYKNKLDFTLQDLDSSNGTFLNGQIVKESVLLVNGDKLQFGDKEFIFIL